MATTKKSAAPAIEAPAAVEAAPPAPALKISRTLRADGNGHSHIIERTSGISAGQAIEWVREVKVQQQER
jgi:hypothetical protein